MKKLADSTKKHLDEAKKAVTEKKAAFEQAFQGLATQALDAFDRETQTKLKALQVTVGGAGGIGSFLFGGDVTKTPTEQLLADRERAKTVADLQKRIDDASKALGDAKQNEGESDVDFGKRKQQLQQDLDDALYDQKTDALEQQAQAERTAAEKQIAAAQQNYEDLRSVQRDQLEAWLKEQETALEASKTTWDDFYNGPDGLVAKAGLGGASSASAFWGAFADASGRAQDALGGLGSAQDAAAAIQGGAAAAAAHVVPGTIAAAAAASRAGLSRITHQLPKLAEGGIVRRPTVALIGEGREPEAVIPLSRLGGASAAVTRPTVLIVELDSQEVARQVIPHLDGEVRVTVG
jgi:hypothetical protein